VRHFESSSSITNLYFIVLYLLHLSLSSVNKSIVLWTSKNVIYNILKHFTHIRGKSKPLQEKNVCNFNKSLLLQGLQLFT
jgi:hypothetical protein